MKKVLGLDLGTTSIGWALVNQAETDQEMSSIIKSGVRVNPLSDDEKGNFEKGKAITTNAERTLKRSMRRNLQRYKLRREHLISVLIREGWICEDTVLSEIGKDSTYETLKMRSKSVTSQVSLEELSRILLSINKKRGYKSSRKEQVSEEDGHPIDSMDVARHLYESGKTPGQYSRELLSRGAKVLPDFYRSDIEAEYKRIWEEQAKYYPEILTEDLFSQLSHQGRTGTSKIFLAKYGVYTSENKGQNRKITAFEWREKALNSRLEKEVLAYVIADLRESIMSSSGMLGSISDRSKELFFNHQTVGQYLYDKILNDPTYSSKNIIFYRKDYLDEFETIWECQKKFHPELTEELKREIRDIIIFYQRPLKSQKGLVSFCEFESRKIVLDIDGKKVTRVHGCRVAPKSSPLFQEFKVWQVLNNIQISDREEGCVSKLTADQMNDLASELRVRPKMSSAEILRFFGLKARRYELNYSSVEGNSTLASFFAKCMEIVELSGHGEHKGLSFSDEYQLIQEVFSTLGYRTSFLDFESSLPKEEYEKQDSVKLWHLLYSYEGDGSATGDVSLIEKISSICGMPKEYARLFCLIRFSSDYASLSHKAMKKILPFLKGGNTYDIACAYAGYNHSHSETKKEKEEKILKERLDVLSKGELRNPVVEKILNQMVHVVNQISDAYGKPDEIHIELARELKQSQKERSNATANIAAKTKENDEIKRILQTEFGIGSVSGNDILRYKLYEELKSNGYKTLYSNKMIHREDLFSKNIDIEHIIPQARMFNDSYVNKTLEFRDVNIEKGKDTARDYVEAKYGPEGLSEYQSRVNDLFQIGAISRSKRDYLLMRGSEIPEDFINRDLKDSQYIAKKAKSMLEEYVLNVVSTTGSVTKKLREDWQLVDVMKELNLPKYRLSGMTYYEERREGGPVERIEDWTKRNDHRHHAMDAITIAFTKPSHIQILNNLNADSEKSPEFYALKRREMQKGGVFSPPMPLAEMRSAVKESLESILVSVKSKSKVATQNVNVIKHGTEVKKQKTLTPRGQLHLEQVYGLRKQYETKLLPVNAKMTLDVIESVAKKIYRDALRARLSEYNYDAKVAFSGKNSLDNNPVYINRATGFCVPSKVKCVQLVERYGIRKAIDASLNVDKVADSRVKTLLQNRLQEYGGDPKKAFSNLSENPIWLNKEKGIVMKKVTILEKFSLIPIHTAKTDSLPSKDYVNLKNNHHVAIFQDAEGNYQEEVVSFYEALRRKSLGKPVVNRTFHSEKGWKFVFTLKLNEMFVFPDEASGFDPSTIDLTSTANYGRISSHLFRVLSLSMGDYFFMHHLETSTKKDKHMQETTWKRITSLNKLKSVVKVRINHIGQIVSVGEYD